MMNRRLADKLEISGAAFMSPPMQRRVERMNVILDDFDTEMLWRLAYDFYHETNPHRPPCGSVWERGTKWI